jgi:hypothetical protein
LSGIQGPLVVSGGPTTEDRSLRAAVLLPGEANGPFFNVPPQPPESMVINTLNIYNDGTLGNPSGTLTSTALTGFEMGGDLDFSKQFGFSKTNPPPFGEPAKFPGGISYGDISVDANGNFVTNNSLSTIQVLNLFLGSGNDNLNIASTLQQGPFHNADGSLGPMSEHGGITTVHGGGNSPLEISTALNVDPATGGAPLGSTAQLRRRLRRRPAGPPQPQRRQYRIVHRDRDRRFTAPSGQCSVSQWHHPGSPSQGAGHGRGHRLAPSHGRVRRRSLPVRQLPECQPDRSPGRPALGRPRFCRRPASLL